MTRRNGKIHGNRLLPSKPDYVGLAAAVEECFLILCSNYQRIRGTDPYIPPSLDLDMVRWREMRVRHKRGDLRHTEAELKSVKAVAQWTVDMKNDLVGQPRQVLSWEEE